MSAHGEKTVRVIVSGQKAFVFDTEAVSSLFAEFLGKPLGVQKPDPARVYREPLVLSPYDALYLCERGSAEVILKGSRVACDELAEYLSKLVHNFKEKYLVYRDLRDRGYIVRSGIKFGADFTVYELGPGLEHAPYVVTVVSKDEMLKPINVIGIGRLSHSVRKQSVLAIVDVKAQHINYIIFKWVKP